MAMKRGSGPTAKRVAVIALAAAALGGCGNNPAREDTEQATHGDREAASKLYAGKPAVVHATEFPVASAAEGIARGDAAWRQGKLDLAVYLYVQALAYDATAPGPFLKIGAIHEQLGNRALAEKAFELALERDPDHAGANERLGLLYLQARKDDAAQQRLRKAIDLDSKRWQSHNGLGRLASRRGNYAEAITHYDTANGLEPRAAQVVNYRGQARHLAGDYAGAETDFRLAISLGAPAGVWSNLARTQARKGRYEDAFESMLNEQDPAYVYNELGKVALDTGDLSRAKDYFAEAISTAPRYFSEAQENLKLVNEKITSGARPRALVTKSLANVYADGQYVDKIARGTHVDVLRAQGTYSLVKYLDADGAERSGWVFSGFLAEPHRLP